MRQVESSPDFLITVHLKGVQVHAKCAREEDRVLGNDGNARTEIVQSQLTNVHLVDDNFTTRGLDDSEEGKSKGTLTSA